jgi:hypothetical protein
MRRCDVSKSRFGMMLLLVLSVFVSLAVATERAAAAEAIPDNPALNDRFSFNLGAFFARTSTQAQVTKNGIGAMVDFENTLGLDEQRVEIIAGFLWRISERWRLDVEYFRMDRSATRTLASPIDWNGQTISGTVTSTYDFSDIRVSGGYSFFKRRDKELGVGFGLHVASIDAKIQTSAGTAEGGDVTAPLPVLSLYGAFALTNEWSVRFRGDWLSLNYGDYSGDVRSVGIDVLYQPWRNVGFGLGTRSLVVDLEIEKSGGWNGQARTSFSGPTAFMTVSF